MLNTLRRILFGQQPATVKAAIPPSTGTTGLSHRSGVIYDEAHRELKRVERKWKLFREMRDNDGTIGAVMFAIEMHMRNVEIGVEPADKTPEAIADAEFLETCMDDMSHTWASFSSERMWQLTYGFQPFAIWYKLRVGPEQKDPQRRSKYTDRRIGWRKFLPLSPETISSWIIDEDGSINGLKQIDPNSHLIHDIPIENLLLFTTTSHLNNPEGRSILRNAYVDWYAKKHIEGIENIGIERQLVGIPKVRIPLDVYNNATARAAWESFGANLRVDELTTAVLPSSRNPETKEFDYDLELLTSPGSQTINTSPVIQRHNASIAGTVLADWIVMGHEKVGSYSLSTDKTSMFLTALGGWMNADEEVLNRIAVQRLFAINGMRREYYPRIKFGSIERRSVEQLAEAVERLARAGMLLFPDENLENHLRRELSLPEKLESTEVAEVAEVAE